MKDGADGAALDSKLDSVTTLSGTTATKKELLADTTTVTANMAQATVNVVVKADVIPVGATETTAVSASSGDGSRVFLAAKSGESAVADAIAANGFESRVLNGWTAYGVDETNYTRTVTVPRLSGPPVWWMERPIHIPFLIPRKPLPLQRTAVMILP